MDDDDAILIFLPFVTVAHQLICSNIFLMILQLSREKKRSEKKVWPDSIQRHVSCRHSIASNPLEAKNCLAEILQDSNRAYMKSVTHLHEWQFFELSKMLKDLILCLRLRSNGTRPEVRRKPPKFDHNNRLFFILRPSLLYRKTLFMSFLQL
jgi:hypothetical protein